MDNIGLLAAVVVATSCLGALWIGALARKPEPVTYFLDVHAGNELLGRIPQQGVLRVGDTITVRDAEWTITSIAPHLILDPNPQYRGEMMTAQRAVVVPSRTSLPLA